MAAAGQHAQAAPVAAKQSKASHDYKGFVAGVGSGIAKLTGMCSIVIFIHRDDISDSLTSRSSV